MSLQKLTLTGGTFSFDAEATRKRYTDIPIGVGCECEPCQNFEFVITQPKSKSFRDFFEKLGIDHSKPAEIFHSHRTDSGLHFYGGWYHVIGSLDISQNRLIELNAPEISKAAEQFNLSVSPQITLFADHFTKGEIVQIDFEIELPWEINAPEPE